MPMSITQPECVKDPDKGSEKSLGGGYMLQSRGSGGGDFGILDTPKGTQSDLQGSYLILKQWYQHASRRQPHPSHTYF